MTTVKVLWSSTAVMVVGAVVLLLTGTAAAEAAKFAALPGGATLGAGLLGALLLDRQRHAGIVRLVTLVTLVSITAVGVGVLVAVGTMLLGPHDLAALLVVLGVAVTIGMVLALALATRVTEAAAQLEAVARTIGTPGGATALPEIAELRSVADEIQTSSIRIAGERARRQLMSWVSHDLRSPLAGIRVIADALHDGVVSDPISARRYVERLRIETDRLTGLVENLFQLSRIESGSLSLELDVVSLGDLVSDALAAAEPAAGAKGVHLSGHLREAPPPMPLAARELSRVVANLLDNAIRETPSGGQVCVELGMVGDEVILTVADECGGIANGLLERWFGEGEEARAEEVSSSGPGLGLAIARGFVEAHDGSLSAANSGLGCQFVVRLPLSVSSARTAAH